MTSKRKLYREDEKLFFLHSYYQSGMSKHAFCRAHDHSFSPNTSSIRPKQMVCLPQTHDVCCGNFIRS